MKNSVREGKTSRTGELEKIQICKGKKEKDILKNLVERIK